MWIFQFFSLAEHFFALSLITRMLPIVAHEIPSKSHCVFIKKERELFIYPYTAIHCTRNTCEFTMQTHTSLKYITFPQCHFLRTLNANSRARVLFLLLDIAWCTIFCVVVVAAAAFFSIFMLVVFFSFAAHAL